MSGEPLGTESPSRLEAPTEPPHIYECAACRAQARFIHTSFRAAEPPPPCPFCGNCDFWTPLPENSLSS